jgi:hypothetical protein
MFIEMRGGLFLTPLGVICRFPARDASGLSGGVIRHSTPSGVGNPAAVSSINIQSLTGLQAGLSAAGSGGDTSPDKGDKR